MSTPVDRSVFCQSQYVGCGDCQLQSVPSNENILTTCDLNRHILLHVGMLKVSIYSFQSSGQLHQFITLSYVAGISMHTQGSVVQNRIPLAVKNFNITFVHVVVGVIHALVGPGRKCQKRILRNLQRKSDLLIIGTLV